ncbi:hypothetical protein EDEG_01639 [Edhazardia aedis USNM 41457]|uniref:Uncharacterized protein n=1 Tax=Edhazardia aedis (strain USNM 41457) TaxID=1003232 RepID=J8ZWN7_EDHAE|nr:hypothetical protein EDEG_01639 [Edhazardia aedis USNM 41457]|eukprot:EJW04063.1 hypothetical protein EDEG_01639 [Edhazardia aedis USNM 41457]
MVLLRRLFYGSQKTNTCIFRHVDITKSGINLNKSFFEKIDIIKPSYKNIEKFIKHIRKNLKNFMGEKHVVSKRFYIIIDNKKAKMLKITEYYEIYLRINEYDLDYEIKTIDLTSDIKQKQGYKNEKTNIDMENNPINLKKIFFAFLNSIAENAGY